MILWSFCLGNRMVPLNNKTYRKRADKTFRVSPFTRVSERARERGTMKLNRDIMKNINKVAHFLAQKQYADHRDALAAECKAMLAGGRTKMRYLVIDASNR